MKKALSLLLIFAMILTLVPASVSAQEQAGKYQEVGEFLKSLSIIKGADGGELNEQKNLTREESIVILSRMLGEEEQALEKKDFDASMKFTDIADEHWASKYINYARFKDWTNGIGDNLFGLGQNVTTKQFVTFMLRALNHSADWSKEDIMKKAEELGLLKDANVVESNDITRGEVFIIMKNTLYTELNETKTKLIDKLGKNPESTNLKVVSLNSPSLKQVEITFDENLDEASLEGGFRFFANNFGSLKAELKDEKTVLITTTEPMKNNMDYKLEISKVKGVSGKEVEKAVHEFKCMDTTLPEVMDIVAAGANKLHLKFSEPIQKAGTVKLLVDGKDAGSATVANFVSGTDLVQLNTVALKDGTKYTVRISGFSDFAGYSILTVDKEYQYVKDTNPPKAKISSANAEYIVVEFDKEVSNLNLKSFYHSYPNWNPIAAYESVEKMADLKNKLSDGELRAARKMVVLRFVGDVQGYLKNSPKNEHPLPNGKVSVHVLGKDVVDNWGNKLADYAQDVQISSEQTILEVVSVEAITSNQAMIKFNSPILFKAADYKVNSPSGTAITGLSTSVEQLDKESVKLTIKAPVMAGKSIRLNLSDVVSASINKNKIQGKTEFIINFLDMSFDGMKDVLLASSSEEDARIRVQFSEPVNEKSALDEKNYNFTVGGKVQMLDFSIISVSSRVVEFVFSKEAWLKLPKTSSTMTFPEGLSLSMSNKVTDMEGNKISAFEQTKPVQSKSTAPKLVDNAVVARNTNALNFVVDQDVNVDGGWEVDKFVLKGTDVRVEGFEQIKDAGKTVVKLGLTGNLPEDPSKITIEYKGLPAKNDLGVALDWSKPVSITDKIIPSILKLPEDAGRPIYKVNPFMIDAKHKFEDIKAMEPAVGGYKDGKDYYIVVAYTEAIDMSSVKVDSFKVYPQKIKILEVGKTKYGNLLYIKLDPSTLPLTKDEIAELGITQVKGVKDLHGNFMNGSTNIIPIQSIFVRGFDQK